MENIMKNPRKNPKALTRSLKNYAFKELTIKQGLNPDKLNQYINQHKGGKRKRTKKRAKKKSKKRSKKRV